MKVRYRVYLFILITGLFSCDFIEDSPDEVRDSFYTYSEIVDKLEKIATSSTVVHLEVLPPETAGGRQIIGIKISDNPIIDEDETAIRILADTHGDEKLSGEISLKLIEYLTDNYESSDEIKEIVDNSEIWIIPVVNPDGLEDGTRYNKNGVDLNRNFETNWKLHEYTPIDKNRHGSGPFSEPESKSIRDLSLREQFDIGISFHTGPGSNGITTPLVCYPPDYDPSFIFPELETVKQMAEEYKALNKDPDFMLTNGADWYPITGSCSDWSYEALGMLELTVELSSQKHQGIYYENIGDKIDQIWEENKESILNTMLNFLSK